MSGFIERFNEQMTMYDTAESEVQGQLKNVQRCLKEDQEDMAAEDAKQLWEVTRSIIKHLKWIQKERTDFLEMVKSGKWR